MPGASISCSSPLASFFDLFDGDTLRPFASAFPLLSGERPRKKDIFVDFASGLPLSSLVSGKISPLPSIGDERCLSRSAGSRSPFLGDHPSRVSLVVALPRCKVDLVGEPGPIQEMLAFEVDAMFLGSGGGNAAGQDGMVDYRAASPK